MFRLLILFALGLFGVYVYFANPNVVYEAPLDPPVMEVEPQKEITLGENATRKEVAKRFGEALLWDERETHAFFATYAQMQWAALNDEVVLVFGELVSGNEDALERLSESSSKYLEPRYDLLSTVHASGTYSFSVDASHAELADLLIQRLETVQGTDLTLFVKEAMEPSARDAVVLYITGERELLPDLVPLPPRDLVLTETTGGMRLSFSTTYYNQGEGPLELLADPATIDVPGDIPRDVSQRIYKEDGTYRERPAGTFMWHHEHIHYHFADFVLYDFEPVDVPDVVDLASVQQKSTFCVRDVSVVDMELEFRDDDATYQICGRERQGISVGWGDTYFFSYPDQHVDVSGFPSGTYRLSFRVNPEDRFEEITKENNISSALMYLDMEAGTVEVLEEQPNETPSVEHIYEE